MKNLFSKFVLLAFGTSFLLSYSQQKKTFQNVNEVLSGINPQNNISFWAVGLIDEGKNSEIFSSGKKTDYEIQTQGFHLDGSETAKYYFVYVQNGKLNYITEPYELKNFIGHIDNVQEAALFAASEGYFIDTNYKIFAANYSQDANNYYLDLGKLTSAECPYQKKYFSLTIDKKTEIITQSKEHFKYVEVYNKNCENHPTKLVKKEEPPKEDPKKKQKKK